MRILHALGSGILGTLLLVWVFTTSGSQPVAALAGGWLVGQLVAYVITAGRDS